MKNYYLPLEEGIFYHIYNRGNNKERIFYSRRNYFYFLTKFVHYLSSNIDTYAYCLLPNHFHFLIRVKEAAEIKTDTIPLSDDISLIVSEKFRRFFISYSQAINKQEKRTGSLFQKNFKRLPIRSQNHLLYLVYYIHANPQNHELIKNSKNYPHSSYQQFLLGRKTKLRREEVFAWFGSKERFIDFHNDMQNLKQIDYLRIED